MVAVAEQRDVDAHRIDERRLRFGCMRQAGSEPPPLDDLLLTLLDQMNAAFLRRLDEHGLSMTQAVTLRLLDRPQPMRHLAAAMQCDASNVTGIADRLEERGLLMRRSDPKDRRVKLLVATPAGERLRAVLHLGVAADLPGASRLSDSEWRTLEAILWKLLG
jgi:DNA-binding MarR family transcriptional regulator